MVGGVLGYSPIANAGGGIANLTNRGAITANGYLAVSCRELNMGGVIGYANAIVTVKNCYNYGTVSMPAGSYQMSNCMYIGGVAGALPTCDIDNIHNYGEVSIAKEAKVLGIIVAGVVGKRTSTTYTNTFANSSNNAPVSCAAEQYEYADGEVSYVYYRVAGVNGWNEGAVENLVNNEKGVITVNGSMYHAHSTAYCCSVAGGVAANSVIRRDILAAAEKLGTEVFLPPLSLCGDNAAMIGVAAYYEYINGTRHGWDLNAVPNLKLGER